MFKILKIIIVNLLIFLSLFLILDVSIWAYHNFLMYKNNENYIGVWPIKYHSGIKNFNIELKYFPNPDENWGREPEGLDYKNKKPIAIFGCSYAYGFNLNKEQTFSYKLAHNAKRPVYNRAVSAWGVQHMLYQANEELLYAQVPEPEYVIFVMIFDHQRRLYTRSFSSGHLLNEERYLRYKDVDGVLVQKNGIEVKSPISFIRYLIDRSYITSALYEIYVKKFLLSPLNYDSYSEFLVEHFVQSKNEMNKHWQNTKYVVLMYDYIPNYKKIEMMLSDNGFRIVDLHKLVGTDIDKSEYKLEDNRHPNEKAWDLVTDGVIKELKL